MNLNDVLTLAKRWPVFPCHWIDHGGCSCGANCPSPGKHPLTRNGVKDATRDVDRIRAWHDRWPEANWAIAAGGAANLLLVDVDTDHDGEATWRNIQAQHGEAPDCPTVQTGGGGWHHYFTAPAGWKGPNSAGTIGPGLDIRTTGGYVMAPGCRHHSGRQYAWSEGEDLEPPPAPAWLIKAIDGAAKKKIPITTTADGKRIAKGGRHQWLLSFTEHLYTIGMSEATAVAATLAEAENKLDLSDGRKIDAAEIIRAYRGAAGITERVDLELVEQGRVIAEQMLGVGTPAPSPVHDTAIPSHLFDSLHGPLRLMWEYAMHAPRPQPELALGAALATWGTILAGKVETRTGLRTNIYLIGVCESGGGKDEPRKACKRVLEAAGSPDLIGSDAWASASSIHTMLKQCHQRVCFVDEFGKVVASINDPKASPHLKDIPSVLLKLTGNADGTYHAVAYADSQKTVRIESPHLCIFGTSTHSTLFGSLTRESFEDGLLARCIIFGAADQLPKRNHYFRPILPDSGLVNAVKAWRHYDDGSLSGISRIAETPDAERLLNGFSDYCDDLKRGSKDDLASVWTRCGAKASVIAAIYAAASHWPQSDDPPVITEAHAQWAIDYVVATTEYALRECRDNIAESAHERTVVDIEKTIRRFGPVGVPLTQLKATYRKVPAKALTDLLFGLVDAERLETYDLKTGGKGRPKVMIRCRGIFGAETIETGE
jgi:hypothetical protein